MNSKEKASMLMHHWPDQQHFWRTLAVQDWSEFNFNDAMTTFPFEFRTNLPSTVQFSSTPLEAAATKVRGSISSNCILYVPQLRFITRSPQAFVEPLILRRDLHPLYYKVYPSPEFMNSENAFIGLWSGCETAIELIKSLHSDIN